MFLLGFLLCVAAWFSSCLGLNVRSIMRRESAYSPSFPKVRKFTQVESWENIAKEGEVLHSSLRVLQFNILADGLSGLRADLGAFSRANAEDMSWDKRKFQLLHEILQYAPDVITLQECDHFYDFFLVKLQQFGYDGVFAPKPASACLEVCDIRGLI